MSSSGSLLLLAAAWIAVSPTAALAGKKFSSPYVDLVQANAMTPAGGRPSLVVFLANRTETTLWARVRFQSPPGVAACDSSRRLAPKGRALIGCPQDTLLADTDYAFTVSVYLDSTLARAQDENASSVRFRREDLKAFTELTGAMTLPQTYEHVVHREKLGLGAMMLQGGSGSRLVVTSDSLEYDAESGILRIAATQITAVKLSPGGSFGPWLVVQYVEAGENRLLALRPSPTNNSASIDRMRGSIEQMAASARSK